MAAGSTVAGPDFTHGVELDQVPDGGMLEGHVGNEGVLLLRRGADLYAVDATCSHYGAPLRDGLFTGEDIRCPWHHSRFDVRSGEVQQGPAFNALSCWRVEVSGSKVIVQEKLTPRTVTPRQDGPESVVIVGAGVAGNTAAEELRRLGYQGRITLVGAEATAAVDRPNLSKDYLAGTAQEDWIPLRERGFYTRKKIDLRTGTRVTAVNPSARTVTLSDGSTLAWGALLIATGAAPVKLTIPGAELPHVHVLRTFTDSRTLVQSARQGGPAVVVGASFIGLEVAASLRARGLPVHVVAPEERPLERVFGPELGDFIRGLHESHGVHFHLGTTVARIEPERVVLADGRTIEARMVVTGIGVRPVTDVAEAAGCELAGGVVVTPFLETSVPGIYAAGDVARFPDAEGKPIRVEHWSVAGELGRVAARNMLGARERFRSVPFFWTQHYDVPIAYTGHAERWDSAELGGSLRERSCLVAYRVNGRIKAVASINRDRDSLLAEDALSRGDDAALEHMLREARPRARG